MGSKRDLKRLCYLEALEDNVVGVEMILNRFNQIDNQKGVFDSYILTHDRTKAILDLELSLATLCILLRKMSENLMIVTPPELRKDMNSIIHSNRFEYNRFEVIVYSQKGREPIDLKGLLRFCHSILDSDKVRK